MKKKNIRRRLNWFFILFHKPLLILFILFVLPISLWAIQENQQLVSFGSTPQPKPLQSSGCPSGSSESYSNMKVISDYPKPNNPPEQNAEINMLLRGYEEINEKTALVDYGGDTDPVMPPSLGTIFPSVPAIVKTYRVHKWDYANNRKSPDLESHWPVNLIGITTTPGETLVGPRAGREIGGGNVLMLLFATPTYATFVHARGENPQDGYFIHIDNFCLDPNLLAAYQKENSAGRDSLPVIRPGQVFGYGNGSDVRIAIRDSGDWMDPRARKDWWQESNAISGSSGAATVPPAPTAFVSQIPPAVSLPSPTLYISATVYIPPANILPQPSATPMPIPTKQTVQIIYNPAPIPTSHPIPTATLTPTPAPLVDIAQTIKNARSFWSIIFNRLSELSRQIIP